jgi:multidrug resistance protein
VTRGLVVALVTLATFTDIVAYSIAVPVLPDLSRRLGASPTMMGLLFAAFGLTLLPVSVPMGAVSDRIGRKVPMLIGLVALAGSTLLFAFADTLSLLFAARLVQGAADAVTWVVGFALIADLYGPEERGRAMGFAMSGSTFGFMIGPTLGGWLYETGGMRLPFLSVAALACLAIAGFCWLRLPQTRSDSEAMPMRAVLTTRSVAACALAVIAGGGTIAMLEPILSLHLASAVGLSPSRVGLVFGAGAVVAAVLHPFFGHLADRRGGRSVTLAGLVIVGAMLPLMGRATSFETAIGFYVLQAIAIGVVVTPSLAYMAEATSEAGVPSFGVAYGAYNCAWAGGLLFGPAVGGFLYEQLGFQTLLLVWSPVVIATALLVARVSQPRPSPRPRLA